MAARPITLRAELFAGDARPLPQLQFYVAVIAIASSNDVIVCRMESVTAVVARMRDRGERVALVVPPRLCTKRSMLAEAQRVIDAFPTIPERVLAVNPMHEDVYPAPRSFGVPPALQIVPILQPTPPAEAAAVPAPIADVAALADRVAA